MSPPLARMVAIFPVFLVLACGAPEEPQPEDGAAVEARADAAPPPDASQAAASVSLDPAPSDETADDPEADEVARTVPTPTAEPDSAIVQPPLPEPEPPQAFAACGSCHTVEPGGPHRMGPNLFGVVGAPAGRHSDFAYSDAMADSDFVWTEERLDAFLLAPRDAVPGNRMMAAPVRDSGARREIIAYLARLNDE